MIIFWKWFEKLKLEFLHRSERSYPGPGQVKERKYFGSAGDKFTLLLFLHFEWWVERQL